MLDFGYVATQWINNKTVGTAEVMNNIEEGISKAHQKADELNNDKIDDLELEGTVLKIVKNGVTVKTITLPTTSGESAEQVLNQLLEEEY